MLLKTKTDFENIGERMSKKSFPKVNKILIPTPQNRHLKYLAWISNYMPYLTTYLTHNPYVNLISPTQWAMEIVDGCSEQIALWQSTQARSFLQNLLFCNALLCIQELVTYSCSAWELLSECKRTYSLVCTF